MVRSGRAAAGGRCGTFDRVAGGRGLCRQPGVVQWVDSGGAVCAGARGLGARHGFAGAGDGAAGLILVVHARRGADSRHSGGHADVAGAARLAPKRDGRQGVHVGGDFGRTTGANHLVSPDVRYSPSIYDRVAGALRRTAPAQVPPAAAGAHAGRGGHSVSADVAAHCAHARGARPKSATVGIHGGGSYAPTVLCACLYPAGRPRLSRGGVGDLAARASDILGGGLFTCRAAAANSGLPDALSGPERTVFAAARGAVAHANSGRVMCGRGDHVACATTGAGRQASASGPGGGHRVGDVGGGAGNVAPDAGRQLFCQRPPAPRANAASAGLDSNAHRARRHDRLRS